MRLYQPLKVRLALLNKHEKHYVTFFLSELESDQLEAACLPSNNKTLCGVSQGALNKWVNYSSGVLFAVGFKYNVNFFGQKHWVKM